MAKGKPAADIDVWWGGLRWVEGVSMQAHRFEAAFYEFQRALLDAKMRERCNASDGNAAAWKYAYDHDYQPFDPRRPIRVPTWVLATQVRIDLELLVLAVRNVLRAQSRLPDTLQTNMTGEDVLELLRNITEHWDEIGGRSADELKKGHPDVSIDAIKFTNTEIWIGDVPLSRIRAWLARISQALIAALASVNVDVPDDMQSIVSGDDALAWPSDRRRYRLWNIPTIDMEDWPTDQMPPEATALIAAHFEQLRDRDTAD